MGFLIGALLVFGLMALSSHLAAHPSCQPVIEPEPEAAPVRVVPRLGEPMTPPDIQQALATLEFEIEALRGLVLSGGGE